jgi:hypothetical protein
MGALSGIPSIYFTTKTASCQTCRFRTFEANPSPDPECNDLMNNQAALVTALLSGICVGSLMALALYFRDFSAYIIALP